MLQVGLWMQTDTYAAPSSLSLGWESWDKDPVASQLCSGLCGCSSPRRDERWELCYLSAEKKHPFSLSLRTLIHQCQSVPEQAQQPCNIVNHHASGTQWHGSPVRGLWWRDLPAGLLSTIFVQFCGILKMILKILQGPSSASSRSSFPMLVQKKS